METIPDPLNSPVVAKSNTKANEILESFVSYFTNAIFENKEKSDLLETLHKQLQGIEMEEAQTVREDEVLKSELKKAKETNAEIATMNATWNHEKKEINEELARAQTTYNILMAVNTEFREKNDQLKNELTRLENENKQTEQKLRSKEIKQLTFKSKMNQLKAIFEQVLEEVTASEADVKKVRQMTGELTMQMEAHVMDCEEELREYSRLKDEVDELREQIEILKRTGQSNVDVGTSGSKHTNEDLGDMDVEEDNEIELIDTLMKLKNENAETLREIIELEKLMTI